MSHSSSIIDWKGDSDEIDEDNQKLGMVHESVIWYKPIGVQGGTFDSNFEAPKL